MTQIAPVLFDEITTANGRRIGIATLNSEKALNALTLEMIDMLAERLTMWAADAEIAIVVLQAAGEKAFCAGANLQRMHQSMLEHRASQHKDDITANAYAFGFLTHEYRLDYHIHTYPKPFLCWGHGIVMGGGIGLMAGASHRVVTEQSRLAMPEISIGLYPDVAGSWLLRRVPGKAGLFLGLTGAQIGAADALYAGLADCHIAQTSKAQVLEALAAQHWSSDVAVNHLRLSQLLERFASVPAVSAPLQAQRELIDEICGHDNVEDIVAAILNLHTDDDWLRRAQAALAAGSPTSARLTEALHQRAANWSLADTFRTELIVSLYCCTHGDFAEGIRALIIDKDRQPRWQPATLAESGGGWIEPFFASPWNDSEHPLADLGR